MRHSLKVPPEQVRHEEWQEEQTESEDLNWFEEQEEHEPAEGREEMIFEESEQDKQSLDNGPEQVAQSP